MPAPVSSRANGGPSSSASIGGRRRGGGRTSSGTGLGLALVDEHVRAHGGWVDVAERPGGGARFIIRLPLTTLRGTDAA